MPTNNPLPPVVASVFFSTLIVSLGLFFTKAIWERHLITSHGQRTKAVRKPVMLPVTNDSCTGTWDSVSDFVAAEEEGVPELCPKRSMRVKTPFMPKAAAFSNTAPV